MEAIYVKQPTPSSCGPTSIKIACNMLGIHKNITPLEIFSYCSNQLKGAPWWRMTEMLDKLNINYSLHSGDFNLILENAKKYPVILSVDIHGLKHWCVLTTTRAGAYIIIDPEIGYYSPTKEWLEYICWPRACLHFCVGVETPNKYEIPTGLKMIDEYKMVLLGEANVYFNKKLTCVFSKHILPKSVFAYNKDGWLMYV